MQLTFRALKPTPSGEQSFKPLAVSKIESSAPTVSISMPLEVLDAQRDEEPFNIRRALFQGHLAMDPRFSEGSRFG